MDGPTAPAQARRSRPVVAASARKTTSANPVIEDAIEVMDSAPAPGNM
jgi:hypothetical protein